MPISISAPVGDKNRITKPDPKKKAEKFKPVANKAADVELVQLMLVANGYAVKVDGKCGSGLISAIRSFQKSALGFNKPDGIVDPGGKTWAKGQGALEAKIKADADALAKRVEVVADGKRIAVEQAEFDKKEEEYRKKCLAEFTVMYNRADVWRNILYDAEKIASGAEGLSMAFAEFTVRSFNAVAKPPLKEVNAACDAAHDLMCLVQRRKPDWAKVKARLPRAIKLINAGSKAYEKWCTARDGTAGMIVGKLEMVREGAFLAVELYMTARLLPKFKNPAAAHAAAAASTEALKGSATELGEYLAGSNVTLSGSAWKVMSASIVTGIAGAVGGKISSGFAKSAHKTFAAQLAPMMKTPAGKKVVDTFLNKFLDSKAAQALVENAAKETVGLFKPVLEKGAAPSKQEVEQAVLKALMAPVFAAAPLKGLVKFESAANSRVGALVSEKLTPAISKKVVKDLSKIYDPKTVEFVVKQMRDIDKVFMTELSQAARDKAVETYVVSAVTASDGTVNEKQLDRLGEAALRRDRELSAGIETILREKIEREVKAKAKK
ncbi:peptidoglycan-binding protein [Pseudorhodobacter sp. E13]|uniref:peptidoglycan-binding domain-containing protein n=1 Tax=Pseudorhodobacter sp. E13 TaxID=2487931 RepID=UPI000F8D91D4|nr:peptidoglycan-binding domain-containing protein [Pseudorhodobacter sp. E13]RUS59822.1 peptidoglycan-binding protein [Pseudorhodobacter sp. E13]